MQTLIIPLPSNPRILRKEQYDNRPNALRFLREACGLSIGQLAKLIQYPNQQGLWRAEVRGTGLGKEYWKRLGEFYGESQYELRDPALVGRICADPERLLRIQERVKKISPATE